MTGKPLVVAELFGNGPDIDHEIFTAAQGLEIHLEHNWNLDAVLLTPKGHLQAVTKKTEITGRHIGFVKAGVTDVAMAKGGKPDLSEINDETSTQKHEERNNWLLIAGPKNPDSEIRISIKLRSALLARCRPILCFSDMDPVQLSMRLQGLLPADLGRLVIAYIGPDATQPIVAQHALKVAQGCAKSTTGSSDNLRFIVGGPLIGPVAAALCTIPGVAGVFLPAEHYSHFGEILDVLTAVGSRRRK